MAAALEQPVHVGVALLASAEGYTPRANRLLETAREHIAPLPEVASALADNLPAPKLPSAKRRRKRRRRKGRSGGGGPPAEAAGPEGQPAAGQASNAPADELPKAAEA